MAPKFSIIIPCHNEQDYIRQTLDSIKAQTYSDFEIIVIDDGSTDNTRLIVNNYISENKQLHFQFIQFNKGHSAAFARNSGAQEARGDYLLFQDADCFADTALLNNALKMFEDYPIDGVATRTTNTTPKNWIQHAVAAQRAGRWENKENSIKQIDADSGINVAIMKREAFEALGGFQENIFYFEDNALTRRFFESGRMAMFCPWVIQYHNDPLTLQESIGQCKSIVKGIKTRGTLTDKELLSFAGAILYVFTPFPFIGLWSYMVYKSNDVLGGFYFSVLWEIRTLAKMYYYYK